MDDEILCWGCLEDISEEVQETIVGKQFCEGCASQIVGFALAIHQNALNDRGE